MLKDARLVAMLPTADPDAAKAFFKDVMGFALRHEDSFALVFDGGGARLRVQKVETFTPHPFTVIGWTVPDIRAAIRDLKSRGVTFERYPNMGQDEDGVWTPPGSKAGVCWFKGPEGHLFSLSQG